MALAAVLLDFDDTLTDHAGVEREAWADVATVIGRRHPDVDLEALRRRYTEGFARHYQAMLDGEVDFSTYRRRRLAEALAPWHALDDELFRVYVRAKNACLDAASLYPDALTTIERLRQAGLVVGVLTNGPSAIQRRKLRATGVAAAVDAVVVSDEIGVEKPDVRAFAAAAAAVRAAPERIAMIGDSVRTDVLGALAAGFACAVWVARRDGELPAGALQAPSLTAAADLLLRGAGRLG